MSTHVLEREQLVRRPRGEVFPFFADAANLERITPEFLHFRVLTPLPIAMRPGAIIDYRLRLFGVAFNWRTVIESFEPEMRFVDVQARGPYRLWRHVHDFIEAPGGTLVRDRIEYEVPLGLLGEVARRAFVDRTLARIFDDRRERIAAAFGA